MLSHETVWMMSFATLVSVLPTLEAVPTQSTLPCVQCYNQYLAAGILHWIIARLQALKYILGPCLMRCDVFYMCIMKAIIVRGDHGNHRQRRPWDHGTMRPWSCYQVTLFDRITYCGYFDRLLLLLKPLGVRRVANLKNNHSQVTITITPIIFTVLPVK